MKGKEKEGINIEVREGTIEDLIDIIESMIPEEEKEPDEDFERFWEMKKLHEKCTLISQLKNLRMLVPKTCERVIDALEELEELKNNVDNKTDSERADS